ncbi:MAG TPA: hypothetical protein VFK94_01705 [Patescibacteria group bacterium]|nr:hypothetical protein [Patescibacteria group bacterium]
MTSTWRQRSVDKTIPRKVTTKVTPSQIAALRLHSGTIEDGSTLEINTASMMKLMAARSGTTHDFFSDSILNTP